MCAQRRSRIIRAMATELEQGGDTVGKTGAELAVQPLVFPPLLFLIALLLGIAMDLFFPADVFERRWLGHAVGWPVFLLGVALVLSARKTMHQASVDPRFKPVGRMITTGLFAFTRNPLYLTVSIIYAGLAIVFNTWWPLMLYPALFAILHFGVVRREERYLETRFGDEYRDYCKRVRRWL